MALENMFECTSKVMEPLLNCLKNYKAVYKIRFFFSYYLWEMKQSSILCLITKTYSLVQTTIFNASL